MTSPPIRVFRPDAAVAALMWPGLGHIWLGEKKRGLLIMAGMLFLIFGGILVGGIDSVDRIENRLWFLAQSPGGPLVFVIDYINQTQIKPRNNVLMRSMGHVNEMGTLFVALAGLLNLVVILDALHYAPPRGFERRDPNRFASAAPTSGAHDDGRAGGRRG